MGRIAIVALAGAAYALIHPPFERAWLSWVVLVPLLLAVRGRSARAAGALGALYTAVATAAVVGWIVPTLHEHFGRSLAEGVGFLALLCAVAAAPWCGLCFAVAARGATRLPRAIAPLGFVAAWVAAEWLRTELGLQSPWAKLGDAHAWSARIRLLASLAGVYGVSALVALGNAALAEAIAWCASRARARPAGAAPALATGAAFVLCLAATLLHGALAAGSSAVGAGSPLRVAVVQANVPPELTWQRTSALTVLRAQLDLTRRAVAADGKPDLVVWPEMAVQTALDDAGVGAPLGAIARGGVPLLLGAPRSERGNGIRRDYNSALLLRTDGRTEHYDKRRLLPWSEAPPLGGTRLRSGGDLDVLAFTPGDRPGLFRLGDAALGVSICFEIAYPALAREAAEAGASVLVNVSNDAWYRGAGGARQHLAQAVFRAIETGLPLVRATPTGISAVVAPDGRVVAALDEGHAGVLAAAVPPPLRGGTLHDRIGDLLPLGCALALLGAWIAAEAARAAVGSGRAAPPPHGAGASSSSEKLESVTISSGSIG